MKCEELIVAGECGRREEKRSEVVEMESEKKKTRKEGWGFNGLKKMVGS